MDNRQQTAMKEVPVSDIPRQAARHEAVRGDIREEIATKVALCLRDWLARNPGIGTIKRLATTSGVAYSTLKKIAAAQHPPSPLTLMRLVEQGGVESLRAWLPKDRESGEQRTPDLGGGERTARKQQQQNESQRRVRRIVGTFYSLKDQLEFLKGENEEGREMFRKYMSKRDAAYMVALLQALFSEDDFQKWIFFSQYRPGGIKR